VTEIGLQVCVLLLFVLFFGCQRCFAHDLKKNNEQKLKRGGAKDGAVFFKDERMNDSDDD
jgi:hypothetical protein